MENLSNIIELLKNIGLTQYEAQVYAALYIDSPQDASKLTKSSGVPKGKIYGVLQLLNDKGLAGETMKSGKVKLYELKFFPESLEDHKNEELRKLEQKKQILEKNYQKLTNSLDKIDRKVMEDTEYLGKDIFATIKGEKSFDYYMKKELDKVKEKILTNFLPHLLIKYSKNFIAARERGVECSFILSDMDIKKNIDKLKPILKDSQVFVVPIQDLLKKSPLVDVFAEARPSMTLFDDVTSLLIFHEYTDEAFIMRNSGMLNYQKVVLRFFMQAAKKEVF